MDENYDSDLDASFGEPDDVSCDFSDPGDGGLDSVSSWMDDAPVIEDIPSEMEGFSSETDALDTEDISAMMDDASFEDIETLETDDAPLEDIETLETDEVPLEDIETLETDEVPLEDIETLETDEAPLEDIETLETDDAPLEDIETLETDEAPLEDIETLETDEVPLEDIETLETDDAPLEDIETLETDDAPLEDIETLETDEAPLEDIETLETDDAPLEDIETLETDDASLEDVETVVSDDISGPDVLLADLTEGGALDTENADLLPGQEEFLNEIVEQEQDTQTLPEELHETSETESDLPDEAQSPQPDVPETAPVEPAFAEPIEPMADEQLPPEGLDAILENEDVVQPQNVDNGETAAVCELGGNGPNPPSNGGGGGSNPPDNGGDAFNDSRTPLERMGEYLAAHNYSRSDFGEYCQDPEWQRINNELLLEQDIPPSAETQLELYMAEHNYGSMDYPQYSQDPEWQRLHAAYLENPDMPIAVTPYDARIDAAETAQLPSTPEQEYADVLAPEEMPEVEEPLDPQDVMSGFYSQGNNEFGFTGTCGPTSIASGANRVLGEMRFTENDVLTEAIQSGLCDIVPGSPADSGGTSTGEFVQLYERINDLSGDRLNIETFDYDQVLSMEEVAQRLDAGSTVHVAVDADTLWGESTAGMMGTPDISKATDHWITVTDAVRDEHGAVTGFRVIDSGGGVDYVDAATYQTMCYGSDHLHLDDPTCVVVSRKDLMTPAPKPGADISNEVHTDATDVLPDTGVPPDLTAETDVPPQVAAEMAELQAHSPIFEGLRAERVVPETQALARMSDSERAVYYRAMEVEPEITRDVVAIGTANGGETVGLDARVKLPESLEAKLHSVDDPVDIDRVSDILRYTHVFSPEQLADGTNASLSAYEQQGYTIRTVKNTWEDPNLPYKGINVRMLSPDGQPIEVQFHTQESFALKSGEMHDLYKQYGKLPKDSMEAIELQNRMFALSRSLQMPARISEVRKS